MSFFFGFIFSGFEKERRKEKKKKRRRKLLTARSSSSRGCGSEATRMNFTRVLEA